MMNSCASAFLAANRTSSGLAVGLPYVMFAATEPRKRKGACGTMPIRRRGAGIEVPYIDAVNPHFTRVDLIEARDQIDQSRLTRPASAHDSHHFARRDLQVNTCHDRPALFIAERDVTEFDLSAAMRQGSVLSRLAARWVTP